VTYHSSGITKAFCHRPSASTWSRAPSSPAPRVCDASFKWHHKSLLPSSIGFNLVASSFITCTKDCALEWVTYHSNGITKGLSPDRPCPKANHKGYHTRGEFTLPQGKFTSPRGEFTLPQGEFTPPRGEFTPPRGASW
jgi:hypothetical protein